VVSLRSGDAPHRVRRGAARSTALRFELTHYGVVNPIAAKGEIG
jgi:hypothetical protein